jgi:hypothetical protein
LKRGAIIGIDLAGRVTLFNQAIVGIRNLD